MPEKTPRFPFPRGLDPDEPLHSARLTLEPIQAAHASEMFGLWQDRDIYTFIPEEPPPTLAWLAQRYDKLTCRQSPIGDEAWLQWALRRKQDQVLIGRVEASVRLDATAQLAWLLGTSYTGQGYAREAVRRMLDHLRDDYGVREVDVEIDTRNLRSLRLAEALGFTRVNLVVGADHFKGATSDEWRLLLALRAV